MKKNVLVCGVILGVAVLTMLGCQQAAFEAPTLLNINQVKVTSLNYPEVVFTANAQFNNPNSIALNIADTNLKVFIEDKEAGTVNQAEATSMPANSDFNIPIKAKVVIDQVSKDLVGNALSFLSNKPVKLRFKGTIGVKALGVTLPVPVNYEKEVALFSK